MRKKNSTSEFSSERSELLLKNFRESLARQSVISIQRAFQDAAEAPAPRFWVSEARTMAVIKRMMAGEDITESMNPEKAKMYREIFSRVQTIAAKEPDTPLGDIVFRVVNDNAPSSYISWWMVKEIVNGCRRKRK